MTGKKGKRVWAICLVAMLVVLCYACSGEKPNYFAVHGAGENGVPLIDSLTGEQVATAFDGFLFLMEQQGDTVSVGIMEEKETAQIRLLTVQKSQVRQQYVEQYTVLEEASMDIFRIRKGGYLYDMDGGVLARMEMDVGPLRYNHRLGDHYVIIFGTTVGIVKAEDVLWGS